MINEDEAITHDCLSLPSHKTDKLKEHLNMISGGATFSTRFSSKAFIDFGDRFIANEEKGYLLFKDKIRLFYWDHRELSMMTYSKMLTFLQALVTVLMGWEYQSRPRGPGSRSVTGTCLACDLEKSFDGSHISKFKLLQWIVSPLTPFTTHQRVCPR